MMKYIVLGLLALCAACGKSKSGPSPELKQLMAGNERYVSAQNGNEKDLAQKRSATVTGQSPIAVIVGCSDSRVPPEIIFDQTLGDIFVVRVAGNVLGPLEMDSVEYAATQLKCPLILILGHQSCAAVNAVLQGKAAENDLENIVPYVQQAVDQAKNVPGDALKNAICANVKLGMQRLEENKLLKPLIKEGKLTIAGGYYALDTGKVEIIP